MYAEWLKYGGGVTNYLAVPDLPLDATGTTFDLPGGTIFNGDLEERQGDLIVRGSVLSEERVGVHRARLVRGRLDAASLRRRYGAALYALRCRRKYSWIKAPRFDGHPMQVGPLAQVLVGLAQEHEPTLRNGRRKR